MKFDGQLQPATETSWVVSYMVVNNSKMADGRHFENRYIAISQWTRSSAVAERPLALRVIEYFAWWLKITQDISKWHRWVGRVLVPISIFIETVCMSYRFWDIQRQKTAWPWSWGMGRSRSLKMEPIDRSYDFLLVGHCKYSCIVYQFKWFDVESSWPWKGHWRSFKLDTGTIRKLWCGFLFAFYSNYGRIFNRLWDIRRQRIAWPWKLG